MTTEASHLGPVALMDHNPRRGEKIEFSPAESRRYNERSAVERVNSHLHDEHGGRHVRVRGPVKVAAHLASRLRSASYGAARWLAGDRR